MQLQQQQLNEMVNKPPRGVIRLNAKFTDQIKRIRHNS